MDDETQPQPRSGPGPRTWLVAILIGACLGGALGTVLFGSPPARIPLEPIAAGSCPTLASGEQRWFLERMQDAARPTIEEGWRATGARGSMPPWSIGLATCSDALEIWGAPLLPARRAAWLEAVDGTTDQETLRRLREVIDAEVADVRTTLEEAVGALAESLAHLPGDRLVASILDQPDLLTDALRARTQLTVAEQRSSYLEAIPPDPQLHPPQTGLLSITLGGLLGALGGVVVLGLIGPGRGSAGDRDP